MDSLFKACQEGAKPPQINDLERVFEALVDSNDRTFVVLDALDECESRQELLDFLTSAIERKDSGLSMIMTSRRLRDFDNFFDDYLGDQTRTRASMMTFAPMYTEGFCMTGGSDVGKSNQECKKR